MQRHKQRTEVRYEDGWLYLRSGKNTVALNIGGAREPVQEGIICEAALPESHPPPPSLAATLLSGIRMDLPPSWYPDDTGTMKIFDHNSFYAESFSADCRSNDALRRALNAMPSELAQCLLSAKPEERIHCFEKQGIVSSQDR